MSKFEQFLYYFALTISSHIKPLLYIYESECLFDCNKIYQYDKSLKNSAFLFYFIYIYIRTWYPAIQYTQFDILYYTI